MIIVTGLGRCGTSFLTLLFKEMGWGVGKSLKYHEELKAGLELSVAYAISRDMFTDHICQRDPENPKIEIYTGEVPLDEKIMTDYWNEEISFREKILRLDKDTPPDRNEGTIEVIKDPRITWNPKIIRAWWEVRKDLKLIILHRDPVAIIRSREEIGRDSYGDDCAFQDPKRGKDLKQFKEDFCDFITEVMRLHIPYTMLLFPDFMYYDPYYIRSVLYHQLGIDLESKGQSIYKVWNTILDRNKMSVKEGETCDPHTFQTAMEKFSNG